MKVFVVINQDEILAAVIAHERKRVKLTQAELADKINISLSSFCRLEKGDGAPFSISTLRNMAKIFKKNPSDILKMAELVEADFIKSGIKVSSDLDKFADATIIPMPPSHRNKLVSQILNQI